MVTSVFQAMPSSAAKRDKKSCAVRDAVNVVLKRM